MESSMSQYRDSLCEYKKRRIEEGEDKNSNTEEKNAFEFLNGRGVLVDN